MTLPRVAYFSMEIAVDQSLHTYSGGLGFLAGSHMLSAGQLNLPMVGVTVLWTSGYGEQRIVPQEGKDQVEIFYEERQYPFLTDLGKTVEVTIFGEPVKIKVYRLEPETFGSCPIIYLSTDIPENKPEHRALTNKLYDSDQKVRIAQEIILGVGGIRALHAAGEHFSLVHLNEGHALPACFEMLSSFGGDVEKVKSHTVFTTHTPVAAGNETHPVHLLAEAGFFVNTPVEHAIQLGGEDFSLTVAALRLSRMANGVSQLHGQVANNMWSWVSNRCPIIAITNAVNLKYWQDPRLAHFEGSDADLLRIKREMKAELFSFIKERNGIEFNPDVLTVVWARRFTEYKRPALIFRDFDRIRGLLENNKLQLIFAGKFHPLDTTGRNIFNEIIGYSKELPNLTVLTGYELELSGQLKRGSDVWLNNPLRPLEASGTSGMSANMNASIHVSTFDGWAVEGTYHGHNGYIINEAGTEEYLPAEERHQQDYEDMMHLLEDAIIPMYYAEDKTPWVRMIRNAMQSSSVYFHSDRMALEYFTRLYKPVML
jgi:starch phosphorylase